jgi:hypothetical protein
MEMTAYRKFRMHRELVQKIQRVPHAISNYNECRECRIPIPFLSASFCKELCYIEYQNRVFRQMCYGC